jgi:hypothetical protein
MLKVTPAGQLATKMPFEKAMLIAPIDLGHVGAVMPGVSGTFGLSPGVSAATGALNRVFAGNAAAAALAGGAASSTSVKGVTMSLVEAGWLIVTALIVPAPVASAVPILLVSTA